MKLGKPYNFGHALTGDASEKRQLHQGFYHANIAHSVFWIVVM
jgi:hypothetical protein